MAMMERVVTNTRRKTVVIGKAGTALMIISMLILLS
jgi:precorrin isomerase